MTSFCQIRRVVAGTALLVATLSSCQRASYVFQRTGGAPHSERATAPVGPAPIAKDDHPQMARPHQSRSGGPTARRPGVRQRAGTVPMATRRPVAREAAPRPRPATGRLPVHPPEPGTPVRHRSRGLALLLALLPSLAGIFGAHRFYLGYYGAGAAYLLGGLLGEALLLTGVTLAFAGIFAGGSAAGAGYLVAGSIILLGLEAWTLVDAVRIALGQLLPKEGDYNPRWFQLRAGTGRPAADPAPK